jgi:hypothetical protein
MMCSETGGLRSFIDFSTASGIFSSYDVLRDRGTKKPHAWWATHGATCLPLIYRQREEWVKGKTKMWDVFPDDMGLDDNC